MSAAPCEFCGNPSPFVSTCEGCCLACGDKMQALMREGPKLIEMILANGRRLKRVEAVVAEMEREAPAWESDRDVACVGAFAAKLREALK